MNELIGAEGALIDLSGRTQLRLSGADRVRYLNGQVTNDVRRLAPGAAMHACVTNAKGKLSADVFITQEPEALRVDADPTLRDALAARLERYIIADDVVLEDVTDQLGLLHLIGPATALAPNGVRANRFGIEGVDLVGAPEEIAKILSEAKVPVLDEAQQEILRVEHGVPRWGYELNEETFPMEAGLDKSAVDFHKGCYIGQEIVSRLKSVGHVNRQLCGFVGRGPEPLQPGAQLLDENGRNVGELTSAVHSFTLARPIALGYLRRGASGPLFGLSHGGEVELVPLPFVP